MNFDPKNFDPTGYNSDTDGGELLPAGVYVFWARSFKRRTSNGKDQILFVIDAIADAAGKRVPQRRYSPVFETVTLTAKAAWRLAAYCQAVGQTSPFNAMSDREVSSAFRYKPFKAKLKHSTYNGSVSAKLDTFLQMSGVDKRLAEEALQDQAIDRTTGGDYDENDSGGGYGGESGYGGGDDGYDFDDSEIPF